MRPLISFGVLWIFASQLAFAAHEKVSDLPNFFEVSPVLYRGGQPSQEGLKELKHRGIKSIISLRHNKNQVLWEKHQAESLGLSFTNIPLDGWHEPSQKAIHKFLEITHNAADQPAFVHCQWGFDRTGCLVAIYRQEAQHWSARKAYDEMVSKGFEKKYAWLADAVFDYEEDSLGKFSEGRPFGVKLIDSVEGQHKNSAPNTPSRTSTSQ